MHSHLLYIVVFAAEVGVVLGAMLRRCVGEAAGRGMWITLGMVGTALILAWAMYFVSP